MAEMNDVITMTSSRAGVTKGRSLHTYSDVKELINYMIRCAEEFSDVTPVVTWSDFSSRSGHKVERCSIVWHIDTYRFVDTVWIKRGYRWYR